MADVTFDGSASLIIVNYGVTDLTAQDIYSWWKQWVLWEQNANWLHAFSTVGGNPITDVLSVSGYFFLENGWRIRPHEADHKLTIEGNLFTVESGEALTVPTLGNYRVEVSLILTANAQSVIVDGIGPVARGLIADAVWDEAQAGHVAAGSMGKQLSDIGTRTGLIPGLF